MTTINVQFVDAADKEIISYFAAPQDPAGYANLGTVTTEDPRWATFYNSLPEIVRVGLPAPIV